MLNASNINLRAARKGDASRGARRACGGTLKTGYCGKQRDGQDFSEGAGGPGKGGRTGPMDRRVRLSGEGSGARPTFERRV